MLPYYPTLLLRHMESTPVCDFLQILIMEVEEPPKMIKNPRYTPSREVSQSKCFCRRGLSGCMSRDDVHEVFYFMTVVGWR